MAAMSKDRRKHPRVRAQGLGAHLRTERGRAACQVENVSLGGLFVRTDRLQEVGDEIFVDIVRPGWKRQLTIAARITSRVDVVGGRVTNRRPGMGLQFLQLDEKQHQRLRSLLRELGAPDENAEVTLAADTGTSSVEDAITAALGEADLPAPGPVVLDPEPPPAPSAAPGDEARLLTQLRGLVMQLSDAQQQLAQREVEIEKLRDELETTRSALQRALRGG
jgi:Tfp pilus assembly protein PilZ